MMRHDALPCLCRNTGNNKRLNRFRNSLSLQYKKNKKLKISYLDSSSFSNGIIVLSKKSMTFSGVTLYTFPFTATDTP